MLSYLNTSNALNTRAIDFSLQQYFFVLQIVLGEDPCVAYANTFDVQQFKRNVPSEDEDEYLNALKRDAQDMLETQECQQLKDELTSLYNSDIQAKASNFTDYSFTGADVRKLLAGLLHNRTEGDLSDASVRDVLALIKTMYENGSLDSDDTFARHFITIAKKYDCVCTTCGHELYAVEGLDIKCPHCGQVYKWSDNRFYPSMDKL